MKHLFHLLFIAFALASCSGDNLGPEHRRVRQAAEEAYEMLIEGRFTDFVGELAYADSLSPSYRSELADLLADRSAALQGEHRGLWAARAIGDTIMGETAHVFLEIVYADSTREEVGLPMVLVGDDWKMQ